MLRSAAEGALRASQWLKTKYTTSLYLVGSSLVLTLYQSIAWLSTFPWGQSEFAEALAPNKSLAETLTVFPVSFATQRCSRGWTRPLCLMVVPQMHPHRKCKLP